MNLKNLELLGNEIADDFVDDLSAMILNTDHKLESINLHCNNLTSISLKKLIDVSLKGDSLLVIRFGRSQKLANMMNMLNEKYPQLTLVPYDNRYVLEDDKRDGCNVFFRRENSNTSEFLTEEGFTVDVMYEMNDGACCIISTALALVYAS